MNKAFAKKSLLGIGVSIAALVFGAAGGDGCTGGLNPAQCSPDTEATDCGAEGDEVCHPIDLVCVPNCAIDVGACDGDAARPVCNDADNRVVDDPAFNNMCVCGADSDCGEGETCDPTSHECVEGEAGPCVDDNDCDVATEACVEGACVIVECGIDEDCFAAGGDITGEGPGGELCVEDTFQCEDPDVVEGDCPAANSFPTAREATGPLLFDTEFVADPDLDTLCDGIGGDAYTFFAFFHDEDGNMPVADEEDGNSFTWAEDGSEVQFASDFPFWGGDGTDGDVLSVICFVTPPTTIAGQLIDNGDNASNAACADLE
jgi:hypothetical protein